MQKIYTLQTILPGSRSKRNSAAFSFRLLMILILCLAAGKGWGQTPNVFLDFGNPANGTTATTANTGFGGVRVGSGSGSFTIQNPGQSIGTQGELRGIAPTGGSINSVGITSTEYGTAATTFTISFELHLSGGASGTWYFFAGNGATFGSAQTSIFTSAQVFSGIRWTFAASSAITTDNRNGAAWSTTGITGTPFAQSTSYFVTVVGNNSAASVAYGASQSVGAGKIDLWVNGSLLGDDLTKGELSSATTINAFRFYGENSTGNVAAIALDNIRWYNTCVLPPTHLALVSVPSSGTVATNLTSYTVEARSGSSTGPVATSFTGAITVAKNSGSGNISGTLAPSAVAGVATYSNTQFDAADTYTILASAASPIDSSAASGNIVITAASVPNLAISGTTGHGSSCVGVAATTIQYTITNSGSVQADGVAVASNDAQFVVSGLSSTSIPASGGTATYNITFTPSGTGAQSATITVTSTTSGSNSPTSSLTGTGVSAVTQAVTSSAATSVSSTKATLNGNVTTLGVCPSTSEKGFVYSVTATNSDPLVGGTGVTKTSVAGLATGAYILALTGLSPVTGYTFKAYVFDGTTYIYGVSTIFTTTDVANHLAFGTAPPGTGNVGVNLTAFTVQALRADNSIDVEYTAAITIAKATGSGILSGTLSPAAIAGVATYSNAQFDLADTYTIIASSGALTTVTSGSIVVTIANATSIVWSGASSCVSGGLSTWLTAANWCGGSIPSTTTVAQFGANGSATTIGFNMNGATSDAKTLGAIELTNASSTRIINNSSTTVAGSFTLSGVNVNSVLNVIVRNNSSSLLTITDGSFQTLGIILGNTTANNINIDGSGGITINSIISGANSLTKAGTGSGILTLTGVNTYSGSTIITAGTLKLNRTGGTTIPNANDVTVNGGTLQVSSNQTLNNVILTSGTLTVDASVTLTINGTFTGGGTIINNGKIVLVGCASFPGSTTTITAMNDLEINRAAGVSLDKSLAVGGTLTFTSGNLSIASNTLTLNGNVVNTSGTITGSSTSNLTIGGTVLNQTLNFTTGSQILKDLTINTGASATLGTALDITAGAAPGTVTVTGTLNTAGLLTIKSNATGTARVGASTGTISGNVTVERYVQAHRAWRFITAPIAASGAPSINASWQEGALVGVACEAVSSTNDPHPGFGTHITGGTTGNLFDQNPAGNPSAKKTVEVWAGISNTSDAVTTEEGYMVFVRGSRGNILCSGTAATADATVLRVTGTLKQGTKTYTHTLASTGPKVIGNPYASAITMPFYLDPPTNAIPMIYSVWDPLLTGTNSVGGFVVYSSTGSAWSLSITPVSPLRNGIVESGSAFTVQFPAGTNTLTLGEADKTSGSVMSQLPQILGEQMRINLNKVNPDATVSLQDGMLTEYDAPFSDLVDAYDAVKVTNFTQSMSSKRDGVKLAIERRSLIVNTDTSYLDLIHMVAGNYQLELIADNLNHPNLFGKLVDNYNSSNTALSLQGSTTYAFVVDGNAGSFAADRFKVVYYPTGPLPVTFTSIKATQQNKNIAVEWQVANQVNIAKYEVEKSTDGRHFTTVATQQPIGINGANATYNWLDVNAVTGDHFYRISSTGFSGDIKLSSIVKVTMGKGIPAIVVYPNPVVNNTITLQFTDMPKGDYSTRLINMLGQTVQSKQLTHSGSNTTQSFAISQGIAKGNYQLQIITPAGEKLNQKIVITE